VNQTQVSPLMSAKAFKNVIRIIKMYRLQQMTGCLALNAISLSQEFKGKYGFNQTIILLFQLTFYGLFA